MRSVGGVVASADGLTGALFCVLETADPSTQYRGVFLERGRVGGIGLP